MTAEQLEAWRSTMGLSKAAAARALGISANAYSNLVNGSFKISPRTELACAALYAKLDTMVMPWSA